MRLADLLDASEILNVAELDRSYPNWRDTEITGACLDSRLAKPGFLYAAIPGLKQDGHDYLGQAAAAGAVAAIVERVDTLVDLVQIQVRETRYSFGPACAALYGTSMDDGVLYVAASGTDGKTSTNQLVRYLMEQSGETVGSIGTPGITYPGYQSEHGSHTTPDSPELHQVFARMKQAGCTLIGMEASSHALDQHRLRGIPFRVAIFTNLSHEHLDYHHTMDAYARAKRRLFEQLGEDAVAVLNMDDARYEEFRLHSTGRVVSYGTAEAADYRISEIANNLEGLSFKLTVQGECYSLQTKVYGRFHAYNMAGALAACVEALGLDLADGIRLLEAFTGVPGRMQGVHEGQDFAVIVDFAVTPRAIEQALRSVRDLEPKRVWIVMGSAGERDKTRRPRISQLMDELADEVILTSDLVFGENIVSIVSDLAEFVSQEKCHIIYSRQEAMRYAIMNAAPGDAVIVCGLGDIRFLIINDKTYYHDDFVYARHCVTERQASEILKQQVADAGAIWS